MRQEGFDPNERVNDICDSTQRKGLVKECDEGGDVPVQKGDGRRIETIPTDRTRLSHLHQDRSKSGEDLRRTVVIRGRDLTSLDNRCQR